MQTIVCMKWGERYPSLFVNRLWSMIKRHSKNPTRLICYTDSKAGIGGEIITRPLPPINIPKAVSSTGWRKISMWNSALQGLGGDILFFDIDMVITGNVDRLFDFEAGKFCVIHNWSQPRQQIGNTSVYRFPFGKYGDIFENFNENPEKVLKKFDIEQKYVSAMIPEQIFWPEGWCVSFKHNLVPRWPLNFVISPPEPKGAVCVAFTGEPDQDDAAQGKWPVKKGWKKLYKHTRPAKWILEHWR